MAGVDTPLGGTQGAELGPAADTQRDLGVSSHPGNLAVEERAWLFPEAEEVFRGIYTRAGVTATSEVLAVCSAISGEGKTTISLGLGVTLAQDFPDRNVLVVETDYVNPVLASDFSLEPQPGLVECIVSHLPIQSALRGTALENLHLLPAGGPLQGGGRILRSLRVPALLDSLREHYDVIILDSPAVLVNSDALLLTDLADGIIFVVRHGVTPGSVFNKAVEQLEESKLRGVVLNGDQSALPRWMSRLLGL